MKTLIAILTLSAVAMAAPADRKKKKAAASAAQTAAKPVVNTIQPVVIPKDAVPNSNGTYSWTDKAGKKWVYSKTPFGISKIEDTSSMALNAAPQATPAVKVTDNGDTVKFERPSPFGVMKWEKKKTELTDEEKAMIAPPPAPAPVALTQPE
jgi:hypothetical protein